MVAVAVAADPPRDWREQIYAGALLIVPQVDELAAFRSHVSALLDDAYGPHAPPDAQAALGDQAFTARSELVRAAFRRDERARALLRPVLARFGLDPQTTYWDRLHLRVLPAGAEPQRSADVALSAHRDSWSSNVYAQVNWWLPLYDITAERAVAFYPRHWQAPIANTSGAWDLEQLRRERAAGRGQPAGTKAAPGAGARPGAASAGGDATPLIPAPTQPPDPADALTVVVQPGDLLLFSAAHLHATVPNTSGRPRFSVEIRTVALADVRDGRGAPNVDGDAPRVPWRWFRRVADGAPLSPEIAGATPSPGISADWAGRHGRVCVRSRP